MFLALTLCGGLAHDMGDPRWAVRDRATRTAEALYPLTLPLGAWRSRDPEVVARCGAFRRRLFSVEYRALVFWCHLPGGVTDNQEWWLDHLPDDVQELLQRDGLRWGGDVDGKGTSSAVRCIKLGWRGGVYE